MLNPVINNAAIANPERVVEPALNTWSRLEPLPMSTDVTPALQACIADPLWLLCRQWQFLEFAGEDTGTPIQVQVEGEISPVARFLPGAMGADAASRAHPYSPDSIPLEVAVEREPIRLRHPRLAAEAGLHLIRMLTAAGLGPLRDLFLGAYPLDIPAALDAGADTAGGDWRQIVQGRAVDSRKLASVLLPLRSPSGTLTALPAVPVIPVNAQTGALDVLGRWLTWYQESVVEPDGPEAWNQRRLEYVFGAGASVAGSEVILTADEYADGTLDWYSVVGGNGSMGTPLSPATTVRIPVSLPSPVEYSGKPADRFWEFEDANVHFGVIDAGPTDLARMLLVEFSLIYGNDWFVVPVTMPVGSIFRTTSFTVRDTFGVDTTIQPSKNTDTTPWSMFKIPGWRGPRDAFFLAPTLPETIESRPIEEVALFRDEMANMVWGVERRVQGVSGDAYDRADDEYKKAAQQQVSGPPVNAELTYRLATSVPENWIPFVPVPTEGSALGNNPVAQLQRRAMLRTETDGQRHAVQPRGVLLRSHPDQPAETEVPLRIEEEEVPREGAVVTRAFQFARWFDGRSLLWLGRRTRPGRGEGSSGLRFDASDRA
ncbi:MAG TPA: hypothetical protein VK636_04845 [Gemmatimonadaceae bacterium]|nr:hypothetical protein [Gemmatimonadaceae bacterium]